MRPRAVAVCGGGHLAHAIAPVIAAGGTNVRLLTRRPAAWKETVRVETDEVCLEGRLARVSDDPAEVIPGSSVVLLVLPAFARAEVLSRIAPWIDEDAWVGAFPGAGGFDVQASHALPGRTRVFGSARTPYIARIVAYGSHVRVTGIDARLRIAALEDAPAIAATVGEMLGMSWMALGSYDAVTLTPSNPLVHPSRLYTFFRETGRNDMRDVELYRDWDDAASRTLLACDDEIDALRRRAGITPQEVPPVRRHYGVREPRELTQRIRSLAPLRGIPLPVVTEDGVMRADWSHRYFTEDFDYGLEAMRRLARRHGVATPAIEAMAEWRNAQPSLR